ncbi:MAG: CGNR zinc finger domain-containing protein [Chitinophagaceae bacterium]|nr:CGNR zinc finger domain-containing protein [Chitinophagaceae bacterium]
METIDVYNMSVCGGILCLDFINTVSEWIPEPGLDYIPDQDALIKWTKRMGILLPKDLRMYESAVRKLDPSQKATALKNFKQVRQCMFGVMNEIAKKKKAAGPFDHLSEYIRQSNRHLVYRQDASGEISTAFDHQHPAMIPVWHALQSAASLLLDASQWQRVRSCPSCGWLFLDTSKGGKRKWCDMTLCGSRDKSSRYYHNHK